MAVLLLDNLPLPSLKSYTIGSLLLFVVATIYSFKYSTDLSDTDEQSSWQIITSSMAKDPFCTWVGLLATRNCFRLICWFSGGCFLKSTEICLRSIWFPNCLAVYSQYGVLWLLSNRKSDTADCLWWFKTCRTTGKPTFHVFYFDSW